MTMKLAKTITLLLAAIVPVLASAKEDPSIHVIPYPQSVEFQKGSFKVNGAAVNCDPALDAASIEAVNKLATQLSLVTGKVSSYACPAGIGNTAKNGLAKGFIFYHDSSIPEEGYSISITKNAAVVAVSGFHGTLYAIQTIKQMLPAEIYGHKTASDKSWKLPCAVIKDEPRYGYRGMHLDCSRHFFSLEEVKKYLDVMAIYKMNRFHWHLTDDQGWRLEIKKYPALTEVGAYRNGTVIKKDWGSNDGIRYGGYYTQEQVKEVIAYAGKLGITIIPEIDLPGHMVAALASYPWLGCVDKSYDVWTRWGISDEVLCAGKESTFKFLEDVLGEVADLFPSEYIHIGGDECPKNAWKNCEDCQAKIKELGLVTDEHATAEQRLQNYVTSRMQSFLATKGKKVIGWDEILEGELEKGATVMSWRGTKGGIQAANAGFDVVMTPNTYCYFDYYQSEDTENEPFGIGGYLPLEKCYSCNPSEGMTEEVAKHILGLQANLWTEYISTDEHLEYMLLPRMVAISEAQWCRLENKDYSRFKESLKKKHFPLYDLLGYNYRNKNL